MKQHPWQYADTFGIHIDPLGYFGFKVGFNVDWEELETGATTRITGAQVLKIVEGPDVEDREDELIAAIQRELPVLHDQMIEAAIEIDVINDERKEETRFDFV